LPRSLDLFAIANAYGYGVEWVRVGYKKIRIRDNRSGVFAGCPLAALGYRKMPPGLDVTRP